MSILNRYLYEELCDLNKVYLRTQNLIIDEEGSDIELGEHRNQIIDQLIRNEKDTVEDHDKKYQKEKDKAKYIILFLGAAVALLGAGFALVPLFIVSAIVLPVLPVLLFGFGIVGITKLFLNLKVNHLKATTTHSINTLDQLKEVNINARREIVSTFNETIQDIKDIKSQTEAVSKKIDKLEESNFRSSQLLAKEGTFPTAPIPIPHAEAANELHNRESTSSPTHN